MPRSNSKRTIVADDDDTHSSNNFTPVKRIKEEGRPSTPPTHCYAVSGHVKVKLEPGTEKQESSGRGRVIKPELTSVKRELGFEKLEKLEKLVKKEGVLKVEPSASRSSVPQSRASINQASPGLKIDKIHGLSVYELPTGVICIKGSRAYNIGDQLERIFHFKKCGVAEYRSSFALEPEELEYLLCTLRLREKAIRYAEDELTTLPHPEPTHPERFRPLTADGEPIKGPFVTSKSLTAKPWNYGRMYFSNFKNDDSSSFIWADGTMPGGQVGAERARRYNDSLEGAAEWWMM